MKVWNKEFSRHKIMLTCFRGDQILPRDSRRDCLIFKSSPMKDEASFSVQISWRVMAFSLIHSSKVLLLDLRARF